MHLEYAVALISLAQSAASDNATLRAEIAGLDSRISRVNQDRRCGSDDDCIVLPMGFKECGGPLKYLVAAKRHRDELGKLLRRLESKQRTYSWKNGLVSSCDVPPEPYPRCLESTCQPTTPVPITVEGARAPAASLSLYRFQRFTRPEDLEVVWRATRGVADSPVPSVDFAQVELIPSRFCREEGGRLLIVDLHQLDDVGPLIRVRYSEMNSCSSTKRETCLANLAVIPRQSKPWRVEYFRTTQNCGATGGR